MFKYGQNKGLKAVFMEPYYDFPIWLKESERLPYVILNKNTTSSEVDLFLVGLFGFNDIDFDSSPVLGFKNLISCYKENGLAISGGILFFEEDKKIFPSCCCGLENWKEIFTEMNEMQSPWMGHDPFPIIEYTEKNILIWSDDCLGIYGEKKSRDDLNCISFETHFLKRQFIKIEKEINEFITISFKNRIKELDNDMADELTTYMLNWLIN